VGKPNKRERCIIQLSGKYSTVTNTHFQPKENTSQPQKTVPKILPWKMCPSPYSCTDCTVQPSSSKKISRKHLDFRAKGCLENCTPLPAVWTVRIRTVRSSSRKMEQHYTENRLGIYALFLLGKCALQAAHFPLSSLLRKSHSFNSSRLLDVSCTLPNAFFYNSENDIYPPKCLFTLPNPKSKGQD
jgi:hypothetical protein